MMLGCGVTVLQNMACCGFTSVDPGSTNPIQLHWQRRLIITRIHRESVSSMIVIIVAVNIKTNKEQVSF